MNTWKRELFTTKFVYLKNGMDESYEMDQLPQWFFPEWDNIWKHDGSPTKPVEKLTNKSILSWDKSPI